MGHHVRAAALHCGLTRSFTRGCTRAVRLWLVLLACLAQLWMPVQHRHAPGFAAHAMVSGAAAEASGLMQASFDAGQSSVPCPLHSAHASSHDGNAPAPCNGDCPCCAFCPCCALMHAALGILPQELARVDYVPLVAKFAATPASLGMVTRPAPHPGQPRAPPVLI
jgi:hypothetical protein